MLKHKMYRLFTGLLRVSTSSGRHLVVKRMWGFDKRLSVLMLRYQLPQLSLTAALKAPESFNFFLFSHLLFSTLTRENKSSLYFWIIWFLPCQALWCSSQKCDGELWVPLTKQMLHLPEKHPSSDEPLFSKFVEVYLYISLIGSFGNVEENLSPINCVTLASSHYVPGHVWVSSLLLPLLHFWVSFLLNSIFRRAQYATFNGCWKKFVKKWLLNMYFLLLYLFFQGGSRAVTEVSSLKKIWFAKDLKFICKIIMLISYKPNPLLNCYVLSPGPFI